MNYANFLKTCFLIIGLLLLGASGGAAISKFGAECDVVVGGSESALLLEERQKTDELAQEVADLHKQLELLSKIIRGKEAGAGNSE